MDATKRSIEDKIILVSTVCSLIFLNILSLDHFVRLDLTRDGAFTLAEASRDTMRDLEDQVSITAYFSSDLPAHFEANRRYVQDLLEEYRAASGDKLSFEFIDPQSQETDEDKEAKKEVKRDIFGRQVREQTSVEKELEALGVQPVQMRVVEEDEARTKRGYMGIVIRYGEETEVLPVIQATSTIEYDLTSAIRRLTRIRTPVLGVTQGKGEATLEEGLARLKPLLEQNYEVRGIDLSADDGLTDDVDALLVIGNSSAYGDAEQRKLDEWLLSGKSAGFLLDLMSVDLQSFNPTPVDHGWGTMLASYGIELGDQFVADVQCSTLNISERRGFMLVSMPVQYPFIPLLRTLDNDSPITRGLVDVPLAFTAPLFLKTDLANVEVTSLAKSSEKSWLEPAEASKMDPRRKWSNEDVVTTGPYDLLATAQGKLPSAFTEGAAAEKDARVFVAGTSAIPKDSFLNEMTAMLTLNIVDWMLLDPALLEMRNRGVAEPPIAELDDTTRALVKYGNTIGIILLLVLFGLILRQLREGRRARYWR